MFGICNLSIVPCRAEASDKSEIVTQLLFGDHFEILELAVNWVKIRIFADGYLCWIGSKQFQYISFNTYELINSFQPAFASDLIQTVKHQRRNEFFPILIGSVIPFIDGENFNIENENYIFDGAIFEPESNLRKSIVSLSFLYLNAPYLWGGKTPFGIDCSGLTQMVFKLHGKNLPRDAKDQAQIGETLSFVEEAEPGDLAFFDNEEGFIIHVGLIIGDSKIIHASGRVRIDKLDHQGIFNAETKSYSHQLRLLKKVI
jgi:hypothetical protein